MVGVACQGFASRQEQRILDLFNPTIDAPETIDAFSARLIYGLSASKISRLLDIDPGSAGRACRRLVKKGLLRPHPYPISDLAEIDNSEMLRSFDVVEGRGGSSWPRKVTYGKVADNEVCYQPTERTPNIAMLNVLSNKLSELAGDANFDKRLHDLLWKNVIFLGYTLNLKVDYNADYAGKTRDARAYVEDHTLNLEKFETLRRSHTLFFNSRGFRDATASSRPGETGTLAIVEPTLLEHVKNCRGCSQSEAA